MVSFVFTRMNVGYNSKSNKLLCNISDLMFRRKGQFSDRSTSITNIFYIKGWRVYMVANRDTLKTAIRWLPLQITNIIFIPFFLPENAKSILNTQKSERNNLIAKLKTCTDSIDALSLRINETDSEIVRQRNRTHWKHFSSPSSFQGRTKKEIEALTDKNDRICNDIMMRPCSLSYDDELKILQRQWVSIVVSVEHPLHLPIIYFFQIDVGVTEYVEIFRRNRHHGNGIRIANI